MPQIVIDADCIGWKSMYMFFALVLATPIREKEKLKNKIKKFFPKTKLKALVIGIPVLFIINFFRILTTILIGYYFGISYFNVAHTILWREGLIFAVLLIWFLWLKKEKIVRK
jgi:exosortase/archaeosortase family protein